MLKKFVAIVALMAMFIVTGCTAPVEEKAPLITADDGPEMIDTSDIKELPVEGEEVVEEGEEISDEILELEGEQITAEDTVGISDELLVTPALPAISTPVIPAVITPEIVEGTEIADEILEVDPLAMVDVDGMIIPAASAEVILAQCLTATGAKLYTASWCGHCQNQKAAFLDGLEYLDHTDCAVDEGWAPVCKDAGIEAVPTWVFADGTTKAGNTPLVDLAARAECTYS